MEMKTMHIIRLEEVKKAYGTRVLFEDLSLAVDSGQKTGLIGLNGAGKTTLLRLAAGQEDCDGGTVWRNPKGRIHFLPQEPQFDPEKTVLESVLDGDLPVMRLLRRYEGALAAGDDAAVAGLTAAMDAAAAWDLEHEAAIILQKLSVTELTAPVGALSGGQRKRLGLARALIMPCDLLILDEPTNHLDELTIIWLEEYLRNSKSAILVSTHDRYFLDHIVTSIVELDDRRLYSYEGNYGDYLLLRQQRLEEAAASAAKLRNVIRRETAWIRRGAQARSTKQKARRDRYEALCAGETAKADETVGFFDTSRRLGKTIIDMDGVAFAYTGQEELFRNLTYRVVKHDRLGIVGPNSVGKSTLLKVLAGELQPTRGTLRTGSTVSCGFFRQHVPPLDEELRVIDYVRETRRFLTNQFGQTISAGRLLEQFLFTDEMQYTPIRKLSGGERRRLYLLRLLMDQPNVLLLDEPTNDLDIPTLTVLERYLDTFQGVVIVVSHDRYFLDRVVDKLFVLEGREWRRYDGDYSDYLEKAALPPPEGAVKKEKTAPQKEKADKKERGLTTREEKEMATLSAELERYEALAKGLAAAIAAAGSDYAAVAPYLAEQEETAAKIDAMTERWLELADKARQPE